MKIQYASDLHLEFGMNSRYMKVYGLEPKGDILLLAGDVIYLENRRMEKDPFFDWCSSHFKEMPFLKEKFCTYGEICFS